MLHDAPLASGVSPYPFIMCLARYRARCSDMSQIRCAQNREQGMTVTRDFISVHTHLKESPLVMRLSGTTLAVGRESAEPPYKHRETVLSLVEGGPS